MKYKLTIAIIVTVLLIGGGIAESVFVERTFDEFERRTGEILANRLYEAEIVESLDEWWQKREKWLDLTVPRNHLTEISFTVNELLGAIKTEDFDSANALCGRVHQYAVEYGHLYGFRWPNIL